MRKGKMDLSGKTALVTGGSKGMGLGIAKRFCEQGANVVICSNDSPSLAAAETEIDSGEQLVSVLADVSRAGDMAQLTETVVSRFGGLDVLVNCAGVQRYGTVVDTPEETWDEVLNINLKGVFLAAKYAIPEIEKRGGGSVINIASVQAYASQSNVAAYTATKGAIVAMTRAMALDHAQAKIRVNAICPAAIDTPMLQKAAELWKGEHTAQATIEAWGQGHPVGRVGTIEEVAAVANFLASDLCPFMTGSDVKVDGGVLSKLGIILPE